MKELPQPPSLGPKTRTPPSLNSSTFAWRKQSVDAWCL